ncbi:MAG: methyltransferase domain-containing protein [Deltaproteobacteria bacterium]|nr:methyltransferase domain-containing protein [Deltaproteobacteria bacterium]
MPAPHLVPAHRHNHPLSRVEIDAVLHALDPAELRSAIVRRVGARSFLTEDVLGRLALRLDRHAVYSNTSSALVHLGGRSAGIGLWLAEATRRPVIAVDPEQLALELAMQACGAFDLEHFPSFQLAAFDATKLPTACAYAVVSMEALYLAQYVDDALEEAHRVLDDGGLLLFDAYVADADSCASGWVHALQKAGFDLIDIDDQTEHWRSVTRQQHLARLEYAGYLTERLGQRRATQELAASRSMLAVLSTTRRIELVARRRHTRFARGSQRLVVRTPLMTLTLR